jgi:death on curing protein
VRYVNAEEVLQINANILGTTPVVRDAGLLASAVGRPELVVFGADAYPTLSDKVAALMESIALNHAFIDGNKRTAVVAAIHMLNWAGYDLLADQMEVVTVTMNIVEHLLGSGEAGRMDRGAQVPARLLRSGGHRVAAEAREIAIRPSVRAAAELRCRPHRAHLGHTSAEYHVKR